MLLRTKDPLCRDLDLRGLALCTARRLVNHDLSIRKDHTLALRTAGQEEGTHRCSHADTDGGYIALDVTHGIVDRHTVRDHATRAVDVQADVLIRILGLEVQKLCDDEGSGIMIHFISEEDDTLIQKTGEDVIGTLSSGCRLNDIRNRCNISRC